MPAYNFKPRFADDVESGRKLTTIRPQRKRPTKAGDILFLFTEMRTPRCRLLRQAVCLSVKPVKIYDTALIVDGMTMLPYEIEKIARADGFESVEAFFEFFVKAYKMEPGIPLKNMELIEWEPPHV